MNGDLEVSKVPVVHPDLLSTDGSEGKRVSSGARDLTLSLGGVVLLTTNLYSCQHFEVFTTKDFLFLFAIE